MKYKFLLLLSSISLFSSETYTIVDKEHKLTEIKLNVTNHYSKTSNSFSNYFNKDNNYKTFKLYDMYNENDNNIFYISYKINNNLINMVLNKKNIDLKDSKNIIFNSIMYNFFKMNKDMKKIEFEYIYNFVKKNILNKNNYYLNELNFYIDNITEKFNKSINVNKELYSTTIYLNKHLNKIFINNLNLNKNYTMNKIGEVYNSDVITFELSFKESLINEDHYYLYFNNSLPIKNNSNKQFISENIYPVMKKYPDFFILNKLYLYDKQINITIDNIIETKFDKNNLETILKNTNKTIYKETNEWDLLKSIVLFKYISILNETNKYKYLKKLNEFKNIKLLPILKENIKIKDFYSKYFYSVKNNKVIIFNSINKKLSLSLFLDKNELEFNSNNELILNIDTLKLISKYNIQLKLK